MTFDPNQLAALAAILRHGSFEAAAHQLAVTPSAISQRLKALEERVGTVLVHRATPCKATKAGRRLAKLAEDLTLLQGQALSDLALPNDSAQHRPHVRIAVNADSLATWFIAAMAATPGLLFDLVLDDQDHSADWLRRGEVSAAITGHSAPVPGCNAHPLGAMQYVASASPTFVAQWFPKGLTQAALAQAPCLIFNQKDALQHRWLKMQGAEDTMPPMHFLPSTQGFADAAIAGLGWGMNPLQLIQGALDTGHLEELNPGQARLEVPLTWQVSRIMAPALAHLTKAVLHCASAQLIPGAPQRSRREEP